ncbi:hypothetical protein SPS_23 [Sphingomonas phage Scott]|uniref:Uncharacterized protein n=1 Tax=Sphingomonas phage Scott TaxID=2282912 RepID=A0A346FDC0_9CAUD|nr:hypothetical protein HOT83_gp23 [Sphingomonas phage Scott]AXN53734.1 hypothetical protein SPS_23 [Sphingomonas phage Scott]
MARRILPHTTSDALVNALLAVGEVVVNDTTGRVHIGDGATLGGLVVGADLSEAAGDEAAARVFTDLGDPTKGTSLVSFLLAGASARAVALAERLSQTIYLWDWLSDAQRASIKSGAPTAIGVEAQRAINFCQGKLANPGGAVGGYELVLPSGRLLIDQPLVYDVRKTSDIKDDADTRRLTIRGAGSALTLLYYNGDPSKPFLTVEGNNSGNGHDLYFLAQGFRLRRDFSGRGQGIGMRLFNVADVDLRDVHVDGWNVGMDIEGVLGFTAYNLFVLGNNGGLNARLGSGFTRPNLFQFIGGKFSGNSVFAAQITAGANISFIGTRFEGNGAGNNVDGEPNKDNQFVVTLINAPEEGGSWADFFNCYFENNNVTAEVSFTSSTSMNAVASFRSCTFQRVSNTRNPVFHTDMYMGGTGRLKLLFDSVAWRSLNGRTPNPAFHSWRNQSPTRVEVTMINCFLEVPVEGPDTGGAVVQGMRKVVLDVAVAADGSWNSDPLQSPNVKQVNHTAGTGKYTILWNYPPEVLANLRVIPRLDGSVGYAAKTFVGGSGIDITTYNTAGAVTDLSFTVEAYEQRV